MNKPISILIKESKETIVNAINSCNLHPVILEMVLKEIYLESKSLKDSTYEKEKMEYELMLSKDSGNVESEV